ncbi:hypothetical protein PWT90_10765 [Aphanocladium album]|nr:hypothetical protein PWT90_10765 [Aphanocladium album]
MPDTTQSTITRQAAPNILGGHPENYPTIAGKLGMKQDKWFYPKEITDDLLHVPLSEEFKREALACGWEYARCVIPQYTNWNRYLAFVRIIIIAIIAEFRGDLVDVAESDEILGYDIQDLIDTIFKGSPGHTEMGRELRAFLLLTAEKSSARRGSVLFQRYVDSLATSAEDWLRMRDTDALARLTFIAALRCCDYDNVWFNEGEMKILAELGSVLYDAVAFFKHRAEGEIHETFAYAGPDIRAQAYHQYREVLWALDAAWANQPEYQPILNFIRFIGGPIHMTMRRYRFVEDGLTIGNPETDQVVTQTRENFKLWNRCDSVDQRVAEQSRYQHVLLCESKLLFDGLSSLLEKDERCPDCHYQDLYGAKVNGKFGGVELCSNCQLQWRDFIGTISQRAAKVFPILSSYFTQEAGN